MRSGILSIALVRGKIIGFQYTTVPGHLVFPHAWMDVISMDRMYLEFPELEGTTT